MPRYRFQWDNLSYRLQLALAGRLGLDRRRPVESLRRRFGARPNEGFVKEAWPILIEDWLGRDAKARHRVIFNLKAAGLGHTAYVSFATARQKRYVGTVRNTKRAR